MKLIVLGTAQDSGYPQIGCQKDCCKAAWGDESLRSFAVSIALVNEVKAEYYLIDVSPDIKHQLNFLYERFPMLAGKQPAGIFLTHAHIGHYTGLIHFSMEAMDSQRIPTYVMPRMYEFLGENAPWSQLVAKENILLKQIANKDSIPIGTLKVIPYTVPHRDEFSETVAFKIIGDRKSILFIPDIDKWEDWDRNIVNEVAQVDIAYLDGSFYEDGELIGRDMSKIKHPYITETMSLFSKSLASEKAKIHFIHLNHTNPLLNPESQAFKDAMENGFNIAKQGEVVGL